MADDTAALISLPIAASKGDKQLVDQATNLMVEQSTEVMIFPSASSISWVITPPIDESWTIARIAQEAAPAGWMDFFTFAMPELVSISNVMEKEAAYGNHILPAKADMFRTFVTTPLNTVKVVIVGQDPYTDPGIPMGMSFSCRKGNPIQPSLLNIFKELADTVPGWVRPDHGDLTEWANQGVLLLNASLTVRAYDRESKMSAVWEGFIRKVIAAIKEVNPYCIYVMWGNPAQKLMKYLTPPTVSLTAFHPSPLSAHRGFFGCNHFNLINEHLWRQGRTPINWNITPIHDLRPCAYGPSTVAQYPNP
jgi:uracil-DNA glycosylase